MTSELHDRGEGTENGGDEAVELVESRPSPDGKPAARIDLKVGFSCNNRCLFCVQGDKRSSFPDRSLEEITSLLSERSAVAGSLVLTGGEPSIRPDIVKLVRVAADLGYSKIQLQTNGRKMAYRSFVDALVEAGLAEAAIAIHGSTAAIHDALTRSKGAFRQTIKGIKNAIDAGIDVVTNSVIVRDNVPDLRRLVTTLTRLGVQYIQLGYVHPAGTAEEHFKEVVPRFSSSIRHIHGALDIARSAGVKIRTEAIPFCFMKGYEDCVIEVHFPDTYVVDAQLVVQSYNTYREAAGKAKGPPCPSCSFDRICEGPWREYPEQFGWDEFTPRCDEPTNFGL